MTLTNVAILSNVVSSVVGHEFLASTPEGFTYDDDGNLTADGRWHYTWDAENRLTALTPSTAIGPQVSLAFEYDWQGRRIRKQVWNGPNWTGSITNDTKFVYDGWNLIAELDALNASTLLRSYVWGLDLSGTMQGAGGIAGLLFIRDVPSAIWYCPAYDGNGNVSALGSMADGTVAAQYEYGPFGEVIRATGPVYMANPFRFSTKYQDDETDLLYYGYRYYSAGTGRWLSRDPAAEVVALRTLRNLYAFIFNTPLNEVDYLGLLAASEGYAFRDPKWGSLGWQSGSGFQLSSSAFHDGWGSPFLSAICNSGVVRTEPDGTDYPSERTSFVKGYVMNGCSSPTVKYRVTCKARLTAVVWGRVNGGTPTFSAKGTILGQAILPSETFVFPLSSYGNSWLVWFQKTVTKDITTTTSAGHSYTLYYVFMPIALQVQDHFRDGFQEHGEATCSIQALGSE